MTEEEKRVRVDRYASLLRSNNALFRRAAEEYLTYAEAPYHEKLTNHDNGIDELSEAAHKEIAARIRKEISSGQ